LKAKDPIICDGSHRWRWRG